MRNSRLRDFKKTQYPKMERSLENLYIWRESRIDVNKIYQMLANNKDWGFKDQIQRAAFSIMNILLKDSIPGAMPNLQTILTLPPAVAPKYAACYIYART